MKLREWIIVGAETKEGKPVIIYTTPDAKREVALKKLYRQVPESYRFLVTLKKGKVVDHQPKEIGKLR